MCRRWLSVGRDGGREKQREVGRKGRGRKEERRKCYYSKLGWLASFQVDISAFIVLSFDLTAVSFPGPAHNRLFGPH